MYRPVLVRSRSLAPNVKKTFVATLKGHPEGGLKIVLEFPAGFENPEDARDVIWDTIIKLMKIPNADGESVTDFAPVFFETDSSKAVTTQSKRLFLDLLLKKAKFGADNNVLICLPPVVDGKARNTGLFYVNLYYPGAPPKEIYLLGAGEHNHEKSDEKSTYTVFSFSRDVVVGSKRLTSAAEPDSSDAGYGAFGQVQDQATYRKAIQSLRNMAEENADILYGKTEEKHYEFDGNVSYANVNDNDIPAGALAVQLRLGDPPPGDANTQTATQISTVETTIKPGGTKRARGEECIPGPPPLKRSKSSYPKY